MSTPEDANFGRRRFLRNSAKLALGATAAATLPTELNAVTVEAIEVRQAEPPAQIETETPKQTNLAITPDLTASVKQSSADKVLNSVKYPFCVFDQTWPFNGRKDEVAAASYEYSNDEINQLLANAQAAGTGTLASIAQSDVDQLNMDVLRGAAEVIESAKKCLDARKEAEQLGKPFKGPSAKECQEILDNGVEGLMKSTRGIQFKGHLAWLRVCIADRPTIILGNPKVSISGLHVLTSATGELWWYHPTFHCSWLCFNWSVTWGWDRLAHLTIKDIKINADAHADTSTAGAVVNVKGVIDRLRLGYPILDKIPLEGVANQQLGDKLVRAFDASQFIASIPVMNSRFHIDKVELPASTNEIAINLSVKQL